MIKEIFVLVALTIVPPEKPTDQVTVSWDKVHTYASRAACDAAKATVEDRMAGQKFTVKGTCTQDWPVYLEQAAGAGPLDLPVRAIE